MSPEIQKARAFFLNQPHLHGDTAIYGIALAKECARLEILINNPHTDSFIDAVKVEAAHQRERWGEDHDAKKHPAEWFQLIAHLLGKAAKAYWDGNREKYLHHIVTGAAVFLNWHRYAIARWVVAEDAAHSKEGGGTP